MFDFNGTLIVAMLSFVVFMIIMNAIFYRPILNIIRKRDNYVNENYENAKNLTSKAQEYNNDYQTKLNEAKETERKAFTSELDNAQKASFETTQEANQKAKLQIQQNKNIIDKEKKEIINNIDKELVNTMASDIVKKIAG